MLVFIRGIYPVRPIGVGRDGPGQGLAEEHLAAGDVQAVEDTPVGVPWWGGQSEQASWRNLGNQPGGVCFRDWHDLAYDFLASNVIEEQFGLRRGLIAVEFVRRPCPTSKVERDCRRRAGLRDSR